MLPKLGIKIQKIEMNRILRCFLKNSFYYFKNCVKEQNFLHKSKLTKNRDFQSEIRFGCGQAIDWIREINYESYFMQFSKLYAYAAYDMLFVFKMS